MLAKANLVKTDQLFSKLFNWCPQFFTVRINWIDVIDFDYFEEEPTKSVVRSSFSSKNTLLQEIKQKGFSRKTASARFFDKIQRIHRRNFEVNQAILSCFECSNCKCTMHANGRKIVCANC